MAAYILMFYISSKKYCELTYVVEKPHDSHPRFLFDENIIEFDEGLGLGHVKAELVLIDRTFYGFKNDITPYIHKSN